MSWAGCSFSQLTHTLTNLLQIRPMHNLRRQMHMLKRRDQRSDAKYDKFLICLSAYFNLNFRTG